MRKHITEKQRYAISKMLQVPMSKKDIAEAIGVDKSSIYREIKRNCDIRSGKYNPDLAQRKADKRKVEKKRKEVFTQAMKKRVKKLLRKDLSPEQIVGRSQVENIAMVSHETIYCWIWNDKRQGGDLHKYLRRQGRKYSKRGSKNAGRGFIPNRVDIDQRPSIVEQKERFGDLEIDTIIGKNHKGAILTINDRATSRVWIRKLSGKEAIPVAKITVWALRKVKNLIHTITADNGKEFAKYWLHNAFLNIDNRKMSKSLGNFFTVREISQKYDLQVLRFFMLSAHYRSPLNFSSDLMEAAKSGLDRIITATDNLKFLADNAKTETLTDIEDDALTKTQNYVAAFEKAMDDDFNTADAIAAIFDLVKYANTTANGDSSKAYVTALYELIVKLADVLGIVVEKKEELLDADIEALIQERQAARKERNFARADEIRDELLKKGIILKDTREGVKWQRA